MTHGRRKDQTTRCSSVANGLGIWYLAVVLFVVAATAAGITTIFWDARFTFSILFLVGGIGILAFCGWRRIANRLTALIALVLAAVELTLGLLG